MQMKKLKIFILLLSTTVTVLLFNSDEARAQVRDIKIINGSNETVTLYVGDTGKILPEHDIDDPYTDISFEFFNDENSEVVSISKDGVYKTLKPGRERISIRAYSKEGFSVFYADCYLDVFPDMTNVSLEKTSVTEHLFDNYISEEASIQIALRSSTLLSDDDTNVSVSYHCSNPRMLRECYLNNNVLGISVSSSGSMVLTITINGKIFKVNIKVVRVSLSNNSILLVKKQTKNIKVKGISQKAKWSSSNPKIAKITRKGKIKAKRVGTTIITAKIGDKKLGCVVSVVTPNMKKVVSYAKKIGKEWKYSQAKRMSNGYYDCSSLVWKAYAKGGRKLVLKNYAPVSADLGKWCVSHKKKIRGGYSFENTQKGKLRPGDLMFETGQKNGRYKGIYHVEMFVGYTFRGFDWNGKAVLGTLWAARPESYYGQSGQLMGRP